MASDSGDGEALFLCGGLTAPFGVDTDPSTFCDGPSVAKKQQTCLSKAVKTQQNHIALIMVNLSQVVNLTHSVARF